MLARQEISFLLLGLSDESLRVRMLAQAAIEKKDPGKYTFDVWADKHIRETALAKLKESQ